MINFNQDIFNAVVTTALESANQQPRWVNAIQRAAKELVENPYIEAVGDHLLIGSPSGNIYESNGVCSCESFQHKNPCWHRAAVRLVRRYDEALEQVTMPRITKSRAVVMAEMDELYG